MTPQETVATMIFGLALIYILAEVVAAAHKRVMKRVRSESEEETKRKLAEMHRRNQE